MMELPESARAASKPAGRFTLLTLAFIGAAAVGRRIAELFGYSLPADDEVTYLAAAILAFLELRRERRARNENTRVE